jgi:hypothetical protein
MATHECPRCGSPKATTVMLPPAKSSPDARPHPAFRCMVCDTQWADDEQWAQLRESREGDPQGDRESNA